MVYCLLLWLMDTCILCSPGGLSSTARSTDIPAVLNSKRLLLFCRVGLGLTSAVSAGELSMIATSSDTPAVTITVLQGWAESDFSSQFCYENYVQLRSMKRARDIREQLVNLMERVEIELVSDPDNYGESSALCPSNLISRRTCTLPVFLDFLSVYSRPRPVSEPQH